MSHASWWDNYGFNCNRTGSRFSNSFYSGATAGSVAQQTKSKGISTWTSTSSVATSDMGWGGSGKPATGNPLQPLNYWSTWKWGTNGKWTAGDNVTEKGYNYEGEKIRNSLNIAWNYNNHFNSILTDNIYNKAFIDFVDSLLPRGFCVNDDSWWTANGQSCNGTQATWSNSMYSGASTGLPRQQTKSKGTPSLKSDAGIGASSMAYGNPAAGNPLKTENYGDNWKYGNPHTTKWKGGLNSTEKGRFYEGEIKFRNCISLVNEVPFILSILTFNKAFCDYHSY